MLNPFGLENVVLSLEVLELGVSAAISILIVRGTAGH